MRDMNIINKKMMLAGLFLAKFSEEGYKFLGYNTFREAYKGLSSVVGGSWISLRNYRDEFDPVFDNGRTGYNKRGMRPSRKEFLKRFGDMTLEEFATLVRTQFVGDKDIDLDVNRVAVNAGIKDGSANESFAQRMMTGRAAENYFEQHYSEVNEFTDCSIIRTTEWGCGFDFKLTPPKKQFLGVEVKGLRMKSGQIRLTEKEFKMAEFLKDRFYLYIVTNFASNPIPQVIENPVNAGIPFVCKTNHVTEKVWTANISSPA